VNACHVPKINFTTTRYLHAQVVRKDYTITNPRYRVYALPKRTGTAMYASPVTIQNISTLPVYSVKIVLKIKYTIWFYRIARPVRLMFLFLMDRNALHVLNLPILIIRLGLA
jgi:hypothetical protein